MKQQEVAGWGELKVCSEEPQTWMRVRREGYFHCWLSEMKSALKRPLELEKAWCGPVQCSQEKKRVKEIERETERRHLTWTHSRSCPRRSPGGSSVPWQNLRERRVSRRSCIWWRNGNCRGEHSPKILCSGGWYQRERVTFKHLS